MKRIALIAAFFLGLAGAALAEPAAGIWQTQPDDNGKTGYVQIGPCTKAAEKLCGVLIRTFDENGKEYASENLGKLIVWDMVPQGGGKYGKGKVWSPDRDKTYRSRMVLKGDTLEVSGCVLGGLVCRSSTWTRVK